MSELRTIDYIREKERAVFSSIPGMNELLQAKPNEVPDIEVQYPDAVFALQTANSLFNHNRDLSVITQRAYFSMDIYAKVKYNKPEQLAAVVNDAFNRTA